jgi:hypothetical protein
MGRETSPLQLLASLLLTGGKGADLVIHGNVFLNSMIYNDEFPPHNVTRFGSRQPEPVTAQYHSTG